MEMCVMITNILKIHPTGMATLKNGNMWLDTIRLRERKHQNEIHTQDCEFSFDFFSFSQSWVLSSKAKWLMANGRIGKYFK